MYGCVGWESGVGARDPSLFFFTWYILDTLLSLPENLSGHTLCLALAMSCASVSNQRFYLGFVENLLLFYLWNLLGIWLMSLFLSE